jgi:peptidoglycan L-alanyl-D-glutamate endopeptidase CwlK
MINSRKLEDLLPAVGLRVQKFVDVCEARGIDVLITSTYRDNASQAELFAQGRTRPGKKVTNALPGQSFHNYAVAADFVPLRAGKPQWEDAALFTKCGEIAEMCGLEWSGRWKGKMREMAHIQYTNGLTLKDLSEGRKPA